MSFGRLIGLSGFFSVLSFEFVLEHDGSGGKLILAHEDGSKETLEIL